MAFCAELKVDPLRAGLHHAARTRAGWPRWQRLRVAAGSQPPASTGACLRWRASMGAGSPAGAEREPVLRGVTPDGVAGLQHHWAESGRAAPPRRGRQSDSARAGALVALLVVRRRQRDFLLCPPDYASDQNAQSRTPASTDQATSAYRRFGASRTRRLGDARARPWCAPVGSWMLSPPVRRFGEGRTVDGTGFCTVSVCPPRISARPPLLTRSLRQ